MYSTVQTVFERVLMDLDPDFFAGPGFQTLLKRKEIRAMLTVW